MDYEPPDNRRRFEGREFPIDRESMRRVVRTGRIVVGLLVIIFAGSAFLGPYVDLLWFQHDARHPEVFSTAYGTRGELFFIAFLISWVTLYASLRKALSLSLVYLRAPESVGQAMLSNAISWIQAQGGAIVRVGAPIIGFFSALGFSNEWNTWLLARHAQAFGAKDPTYGIDLGFFVFVLPWYRAMANYALVLIVLTAVLTVGIYVGMQALALLAKIELSRPHIRFHVGVLIALTLFAFAAQMWLKTYEIGLSDGGQFTGAGYAGVQEVSAQRIVAILSIIAGVLSLVGTRVGKPYGLTAISGGALVVFYLAGVMAWPSFVQRFFVDPNRLNKEAPYASRAIQMTRYAYGLDSILLHDVEMHDAPSPAEVAASKPTLDNMRLWDPDVLRESLETLQAIRPYYRFRDVDIDRYVLGGKETMVMVAPRDIDLSGLSASAQNWTNQRLRYTHGYGVVMSQVDAASPDGDPALLTEDIPVRFTPELKIDEPRIYFSDQRDANGQPTDDYAIVKTEQSELDYETASGSQTHRWTGDRGIPIGGFLSRLAISALFGDGNLLVSSQIGPESRLLMRRNVVERCSKIYPFLKFDHDPYMVELNGRLIWILDGYTSTEMIPYSAHVIEGDGTINYLRNSVKAVVDAYTGEATAYAVEPNEPILKAYRSIYPGLVKDASTVPAGLREHFRYPEDLFDVQTNVLAIYHMTDPTVFLSNGDAWSLAKERSVSGTTAPIQAYYVMMQLPEEQQSGMFLIRPFTPSGRPNMIGWLAAHCDPVSYGKMSLYRFSKGSPVSGPESMESKFTSTPEIANINRQFNNDTSQIVVGNMLVVPIGGSVMYAESLFLKSRTAGIQALPRLTRVVLALNNKVVVGETYADALNKLFGAPAPEAVVATREENPTTTSTVVPAAGAPAGVREALKILDDADAALRKGDFAHYGDLQKQLREKLKTLAGGGR